MYLNTFDGLGLAALRCLLPLTAVSYKLHCRLSLFSTTDCTAGLAEETERCENVEHAITLIDTVELAPDEIAQFEVAVFEAIVNGDLQQQLPPDSVVRILTGLQQNNVNEISAPMVPPEDGGLTSGGTAGIVIAAALAVTVLPLIFYLSMRRKEEDKEPYVGYDVDEVSAQDLQEPDEEVAVVDVESRGKSLAVGTLGASPTDYGKSQAKHSTPKSLQKIHKVPSVSPGGTPDRASSRDEYERDQDSSSNAGDSGWSSNDGMSSMNTGSAEDSDMLPSPPTSLAAIGAASAVSRRLENNRNRAGMSPYVNFVCPHLLQLR